MAYVIGIDTGGTFTDAFVADQHNRLAAAKTPSTPPDFATGFLTAIDELAAELGIPVRELLANTDYLVHGTTSTLNALVTGDVAQVGFLTTRGHADSISIMNLEGRYAGLGSDDIQHMARTAKPASLVPRHRIREIDERVDYQGRVVVPLDEDGVRTAVRDLLADGAEAIAVSLLWSFRNPAHEQRVRAIVREEAPEVYVALSSEVSPRIREYPRNVTTIMNTQVGPRLGSYLRPLEAELRERGLTGALLVMQGSGGCVTAADAPAHAITTIGSVLTGGVVGCTRMAASLGHDKVISTDMGGTTFLVGLVVDGKPVTTTSTILNQYTISTPMVDVHTIGAGGGAIAWVDLGGNLRVGPRSAGARPGPACYGEGGWEPTVTDADLVLGIINPDNFLGGRKKLDVQLSRDAIDKVVATPLGMSVEDAAAAIYAIQNAQTADLVRKVVVNSGQDPRDFTLYAFGGAGPMHCASYSADLGVKEVVVPLGSTAAVFSAYGLAASDIVLTAEQSQPVAMPVAAETANEVFTGLERELERRLAEQGLTFSAISYEREADIRYTMQLAEVATPVPGGELSDESVEQLGRDFEASYEALYGKGSGFPDAGLQLITYRVRATGILQIQPELPEHGTLPGNPATSGEREVLLDVRTGRQPAAIYDYRALGAGHEIEGPAVVEAPTTTVALPPGTQATVDRLGNLVIRFPERKEHS
ncbi:hydantoinase/oxoprolinase family protein [Amycolatopsis dendrobii]|uniref:Hydantoinase/oxoprolinase family protein n=1 Tax=Amycolatopsis dendrobii TaxID=2760662 RepID=A0A7W3Z8H7_9PSEU|nr:hydantoinase/oxoprolinase family protein [Amycolatopsis dendrobii]MBB1152205.1 hydantoinase/oxoprolinase family protein [Amycolatopsis dendrobii]